MSSTTTNLKNINFMSESKYDSLTEIHDDELYAVKIDGLDGEQLINQNPNEDPIKVWTGTQEEYDALSEYDASTLYNITDGAGGDTIATTNGNNTFTGTNNFVTPALNDNTTKVATTAWVNSVVNNKMSLTLLDFKWTDHILNNISWLRADTFSWQDGGVYEAAYDHLEDDFTIAQAEQGRLVDDKIIPTYYDTIGSHTIYYWLAEDGHKIITDLDDEQTLIDIYNESGVTWYYLLDTGNTRFKLPRTKYGFVGLRDGVGNYVPESLPNITGDCSWFANGVATGTWGNGSANNVSSGALTVSLKGNTYGGIGVSGSDSASSNANINIDASKSSSTYQNNAPVQQRATQMYLYFYVGQYSQTAIEQTAGLNSELFNGKMDRDMSNMNASTTAKETIVGWGIPDYDSAVSLSAPTTSYQDYTATKPCMIELLCFYMSGELTYKINNHEYNIGGNTTSQQQVGCLMHIYLGTGDVLSYKTQYTNYGTTIVNRATMFPLKGV